AELRFDIPRLGRRVIAATEWAISHPVVRELPIGYFGASTGAAAALIAAAELAAVRAVVSRGGRPDLAGDALPSVQAPTLLIVGGDDEPVIEMNENALRRMRAPVELAIVPGATHLREEAQELQRRERAYREGRPAPALANHIVILVDDGLATGSTMRAAAQAVRAHRPSHVVVAVPVGASQTCRELSDVADEVICARMPEPFSAVGQWYRNFDQTDDEEVRDLLQK